jgi:hypothetical protein
MKRMPLLRGPRAAQTSQVNPQVLLTTLEKEQTAMTRLKPLPNDRLRFIMGFGKPSTIRDQVKGAAAQFRRDFDRLSQDPPRPTAGGWKVGVAKDTLDPMTVKPASKAAAILYSYGPWVGKAFGGRSDIGGDALFCQVWEMFEFGEKALVLRPENPILACSSAKPSVPCTAKGGRAPLHLVHHEGSYPPKWSEE